MGVIVLELGVLALGGFGIAVFFAEPLVALGFLVLGGAAISLVVGRPMVALGFLVVAGAVASMRIVRPTRRPHGAPALAAHVVVRLAAALVLAIATAKVARYDAGRYRELVWLIVILGALAVLAFATGVALVWIRLANSGTTLCRVGLHRWTDVWSDAGAHRACARCGERTTPKRRAIWSAAALGAFVFLAMPAAALAVRVYVAYRPLTPYSFARTTACWRAHGYRISRPERDHRFIGIEIRGHHNHEYATFGPNQRATWIWVDENYDGGGDYYSPPPVPVRNVVFGTSGTFGVKPLLACLRT